MIPLEAPSGICRKTPSGILRFLQVVKVFSRTFGNANILRLKVEAIVKVRSAVPFEIHPDFFLIFARVLLF